MSKNTQPRHPFPGGAIFFSGFLFRPAGAAREMWAADRLWAPGSRRGDSQRLRFVLIGSPDSGASVSTDTDLGRPRPPNLDMTPPRGFF